MARPFNAGKATVDALRTEGWAADLVERRFGGFAHDYLGFADIIALKGGIALAVQATSSVHVKDRYDKIRVLPGTRKWLTEGGLLAIWGWHKVKRIRGGKAFKWEPTRKVPVSIEDLA